MPPDPAPQLAGAEFGQAGSNNRRFKRLGPHAQKITRPITRHIAGRVCHGRHLGVGCVCHYSWPGAVRHLAVNMHHTDPTAAGPAQLQVLSIRFFVLVKPDNE